MDPVSSASRHLLRASTPLSLVAVVLTAALAAPQPQGGDGPAAQAGSTSESSCASVAAARNADGSLQAELLPGAFNATDCGVVGERVRFADVFVHVPPPGHGAGLTQLETGAHVVLEVQTGLDAVTTVSTDLDVAPQVEGQAAGPGPAPPGEAACLDDAFAHLGTVVQGAFEYFTNVEHERDDGMANADEARAGFKSGFDIQLSQHNDCGLADQVNGTAVLVGDTDRVPDMTAGGCDDFFIKDGTNVVSFLGHLDTGRPDSILLARTCRWWLMFPGGGPYAIDEADIGVNAEDRRWARVITSTCEHSSHLDSAMAHEVGHVFGLDHPEPYEEHGRLTMAELQSRCRDDWATLGEGDVLGMRALYPLLPGF